MKQELQTTNPVLHSLSQQIFSSIRRNLNSLKQKQTQTRRQALTQFLKTIKQQNLSSNNFQQITHMSLKQLLKCFSDSSENNRQNAVIAVNELISRCVSIRGFLPYIFAVMMDRTNCVDLEGIANVPQKMRPAPGQKPKMMIKLIENCEEIRLLYCSLMKRILSLVEEDDIRDKLDEIVNILRALIMDPAPEVQKNACEVLQFFCKQFKMILLHYTEIMGRAVLLPLVSKKSKIRIAGLNALTAVLWCGLWKYNAFVFQNLIGFRDPNSVPIKDFYEPSNNINYFATFINDQNSKVRLAFLQHIKIWTCILDDKYDHHGRIVPYILSGLFDPEEQIRNVAKETIDEIGRQIQVQKEKDFREGKQYAIDAKWTWDGELVGLETREPLKGRPALGSRVFVRGHVRKFWTALYKQIKDIHFQNRLRAASLILFGTIYTQNYMSQYLHQMLPHLLSSTIPSTPQDTAVSSLILRTLHLIGRYCEFPSYSHVITSALKGELVQNQHFLKSTLKGLTQLVNGSFEAIPGEKMGLRQKKEEIMGLIGLIQQAGICGEIYRSNCQEGMELSKAFLEGIDKKATKEDVEEIMEVHCLSIMKLMAVSYYQLAFGDIFIKQKQGVNSTQNTLLANLTQAQSLMRPQLSLLTILYPTYFSLFHQFLQQSYLEPPTLMDSSWKLTIFMHRLLCGSSQKQQEKNIAKLAQEVILCSMQNNNSIQIIVFGFRYVQAMVQRTTLEGGKGKVGQISGIVRGALENMKRLDPVKKVPIYDQHLQKTVQDPSLHRITSDIYVPLFLSSSHCLQSFYLTSHWIPLPSLAHLLHLYLTSFSKFFRDKQMVHEAIRTLWVIFEKVEIKEEQLKQLCFEGSKEEGGGRVVVMEEVVDFLMARLETLIDAERGQINMVFDIFRRVVNCCPKIQTAATKLLDFYPNYPGLLQKLFKYTMDERDVQSKNSYIQLLETLCKKMRPWFELQLRLSQEKDRFGRIHLLKNILDNVR